VIDDLTQRFPVGTDLEDFLQGEAEHFTALTGLPCETSIDARVEVPDPLAVQIEKIISEGLTNIVNHAQARRSWVHLNSEAGQITWKSGMTARDSLSELASSRAAITDWWGYANGRGWQAER